MRDGFVYFAHGFRWGRTVFKVGFSKQPKWRLKELSTKESPLTEIAIVPGTLEAERALHEMLSAYRVHNEWYRSGKRLQRTISYCASHGALPDSILQAGEAWLAAREAKRSYRDALATAGAFFRDDEAFGLTRQTDPFPLGKKFDPEDISWLPSGLSRAPSGLQDEG